MRAHIKALVIGLLALSSSVTAAEKLICINNIPHVHQKADFCGEACVEMWLKKLGSNLNQNDIFNFSGLDPSKGRGCYAPDLYKAIVKVGFDPGSKKEVWIQIPAKDSSRQIQSIFDDIKKDLQKNIPSIVCTHYSDKAGSSEHFRLIVGYDPAKSEVIYHEPAEAGGAYKRMKLELLKKIWPLKYSEKTHTMIRFRLKPSEKIIKSSNSDSRALSGEKGNQNNVSVPKSFTNADYAQHILKLKKSPPLDKLTYIVEKPFVVVGNQSSATVKRYSAGTVRWATAMFRKHYFKKPPSKIITIWLLGDNKSYLQVSKKITGSNPGTPYGFFSDRTDSMIMNIATGGGTLVHEMFHAFVPTNFPKLPSWVNEGIASLYEQCGQRGDMIVGRTNWRLRGLQTAIRKKNTVSFKVLTSCDFYGANSGNNYAQARYLCYYLQEKGLLLKFYRDFQANQKNDPTGYKTLIKTLGSPDMEKFRKTWETWCMGLRFP